jgi:hypothetical protein
MNPSGHDPRHARHVNRRGSGVSPTMPIQTNDYRVDNQRNRVSSIGVPASAMFNESPQGVWDLRDQNANLTPRRHGRQRRRHGRQRSVVSWAAVGTLTVFAVLGLALVAVADNLSSRGYAYHTTSVFFWAGMLLIFVPMAGRVLMRGTGRSEQLALIILVGIALYVVKVLASPDGFTNYDEYIHWRNTADILRTHHLFSYNPLLPTASYYPGLAAITAGLVDLTGLSTFASGLIVIGLARILISASFFLIAESVTGSSRAASLASLVYITNPMFLFWSSSFAYEDLGLPLVAFVIWWFGKTRNQPGYLGSIVTVISIAAIVMTHHLAGVLLAALLVTWWLIERFTLRSTKGVRSLGIMALISTAAALIWLFVVARPAVSYLFTDNITPALDQTGSLILHRTSTRHLYASGGYVSPAWETFAGFAAVGILVLSLPGGLYLAWHVASVQNRAARAGRLRMSNAPMIIAVALAIAYPLSLIPRLTPGGVAISGRSSEWVFAGLGCVLGLFAEASALQSRGNSNRLNKLLGRLSKTPIIICSITIVFIGNITIGTPFYQRLPEESNPPGYPWSVQPDAIAASIWTRKHLGVNQRIGTDATNAVVLATYGDQDTLAEEDAWPIFFATTMNESVVREIRADKLRYVLLDWRMTLGVPPSPGYYFSPQETNSGIETQPFPAVALRKFRSNCSRLIYESGYIQIFDLSRIENGSCTPKSAGHHTGGAGSS